VFWVLLSALVHYCWVHDRNVIWHVKNFLSYLMHSFSYKLTVTKLVEKWWEIDTWLPFHTWCLLYVTDQKSFNSCMSHLWELFKFLPPITMYTIILSICYNHDLCHHCNMAKWIELSWVYFQLILYQEALGLQGFFSLQISLQTLSCHPGWLWSGENMIILNVTWRRFDQSVKQLIVGHTTMLYVSCEVHASHHVPFQHL